jgi:hypothetical protein
MNRETRDKFASRTQADVTSGNAVWQTPPLVFAALHAQFGPFDVDLTADPARALCGVWFGPGNPTDPDALIAPWHRRGRCGFSNPPYGPFVPQLLAKAQHEAAFGFTSVLLLPMRATKAFHRYVLGGASELWFCDKRIAFFEEGLPRINAKTWKKTGYAIAACYPDERDLARKTAIENMDQATQDVAQQMPARKGVQQ